MGPGKRTRGGKKPPRPPAVLPDSVATCCLTPTSTTMLPGKMTPGAKSMPCGKSSPSFSSSVLPDPATIPHLSRTSNTMPEILDQEDIDLSSLRARNILRNNQYAQRLGVRRLAELLQSSFAKKRSVEKIFEKKSKALLLEEDVGNSMLPPGDCVKAGTGRTSKRVLAPENKEDTMRCTRQRAAREQMSTTSLIEATEGGLEPEFSANQNQGGTNNIEQEARKIQRH
ncbi:hypothetical protein BDA96_08G098000 [Sorghum bicolor]|uniref:Uncharacterized protein n=1 Tax=Sorghum bicolor TaxID=4558 RepID=A0A921QF62_SORBI|nr:hypothetical protein BDA96_08G098000 [Sorghum bicolor]